MTSEMTAQDAVKPADKPASVAWVVLTLLVAIFVLIHDLSPTFYTWSHTSYASTGLRTYDFCDGDGWCGVAAIRPGAPADAAGLRPDDTVRFDHGGDYMRPPQFGETIGVTLRRDGVQTHYALVPARLPMANGDLANILLRTACVITALIGVLLVIRSQRRSSALLLGAAYSCCGLVGSYPTTWEGEPHIYPLVLTALFYTMQVVPLLFVAFSLRLRTETGRPTPAACRIAFYAYAALALALCTYQDVATLVGHNLPGVGGLFMVTVILNDLGLLAAAIILADSWRTSVGTERTRHAFMIVAMLLTAGLQIFGTAINLTGNDWSLNNPLVIADIIAPVAGAAIFAYALLRHRVIDLGFAVNQTLIYGILSFLILLVFGLAEWGVEKILPQEWHEHLEANAFVSAGIALCIFLVFHRIRDAVEHVVEGIFFRRWRDNEARLNRFVKQAGFVTRPEALVKATVAEFHRFSGGADVALYRQQGTAYALAGGVMPGLAPNLDPDMAELVTLRAEHQPLDGDSGLGLHAALVLPMLHRSDLSGFIALGPKPGGDAWRPDERALLAHAAHQIGLDLHALRIEELEQANAELTAQMKLAFKPA